MFARRFGTSRPPIRPLALGMMHAGPYGHGFPMTSYPYEDPGYFSYSSVAHGGGYGSHYPMTYQPPYGGHAGFHPPISPLYPPVSPSYYPGGYSGMLPPISQYSGLHTRPHLPLLESGRYPYSGTLALAPTAGYATAGGYGPLSAGLYPEHRGYGPTALEYSGGYGYGRESRYLPDSVRGLDLAVGPLGNRRLAHYPGSEPLSSEGSLSLNTKQAQIRIAENRAQLTSLPAGKREQAREEAGALRKDLKAETDHLERHAIAEEKKDLAVEEALAAQSYRSSQQLARDYVRDRLESVQNPYRLPRHLPPPVPYHGRTHLADSLGIASLNSARRLAQGRASLTSLPLPRRLDARQDLRNATAQQFQHPLGHERFKYMNGRYY